MVGQWLKAEVEKRSVVRGESEECKREERDGELEGSCYLLAHESACLLAVGFCWGDRPMARDRLAVRVDALVAT